MSIIRFFLIASMIVLAIAAALAYLPDRTLAANEPPNRGIPAWVSAPCQGCPPPTSHASGGFRRSVSLSALVTDKTSLNSVGSIEPTTEPCVLVDIKGPGGIRGVTCWEPTTTSGR